jgi:hypothetical protein
LRRCKRGLASAVNLACKTSALSASQYGTTGIDPVARQSAIPSSIRLYFIFQKSA